MHFNEIRLFARTFAILNCFVTNFKGFQFKTYNFEYFKAKLTKAGYGLPTKKNLFPSTSTFKVVYTPKGMYENQQFCLKLEGGGGYLKLLFSANALIEGLGLACLFNV